MCALNYNLCWVYHDGWLKSHIEQLSRRVWQSFGSISHLDKVQPAKPGGPEQKQVNVNQWCRRLCRAKSWLRFNRSVCTMPEWWRMHVDAQCFLYWLGSVPHGFTATSSEKRCTTHPASPGLTSDTAQRIAGARHHGQGCNTLVHHCSNRSLCCMVYCPRFASLSRRACTSRSDADTRFQSHKVFAPSPRKPGTLDLWKWV